MQDDNSKPGRNEPFSLHGMTPEEALIKAMSTPPKKKGAVQNLGKTVGEKLSAAGELDAYNLATHAGHRTKMTACLLRAGIDIYEADRIVEADLAAE